MFGVELEEGLLPCGGMFGLEEVHPRHTKPGVVSAIVISFVKKQSLNALGGGGLMKRGNDGCAKGEGPLLGIPGITDPGGEKVGSGAVVAGSDVREDASSELA